MAAASVWTIPVEGHTASNAHLCIYVSCVHWFPHVFFTQTHTHGIRFLTGTQPVPAYGRHVETGREIQWLSLGLHRDWDETRPRRQRKSPDQETIGGIATPLQKQHLFLIIERKKTLSISILFSDLNPSYYHSHTFNVCISGLVSHDHNVTSLKSFLRKNPNLRRGKGTDSEAIGNYISHRFLKFQTNWSIFIVLVFLQFSSVHTRLQVCATGYMRKHMDYIYYSGCTFKLVLHTCTYTFITKFSV